ncbi:MAG: cytidylate kinase-like family protein [bacterium]
MDRFDLLPSIDARIHVQAERWRRHQFIDRPRTADAAMPFITISRQYGCPAWTFAEEIARRLNQRLGSDDYVIYDKKLLEWITANQAIETDLVDSLNEKRRGELEDWVVSLISGRPSEWSVFKGLAKAVRGLALHGRAILIGRGSAQLTRDLPGGLHIRLIAPPEWRLSALEREWPNRAENVTMDTLLRLDRDRESYVRKYTGVNPNDPEHYDITLNTARLSVDQQADAVERLLVMI